jgi:MoaA/NifB/PqqE/SkfB family radical SAM enzyme
MSLRKTLLRARAMRDLGEALLAPAVPSGRPVHMHLELTTVCDHACPVCIRSISKGGEHHMATRDACARIDEVEPRFLSLNGVGEPLLHPEWDEIVAHAIRRHVAAVSFATAGTLVEEQAERICRSGLHLVKISFHGATADTFARLASGRELARVEQGIERLHRVRADLGRGPQVRLNYVVSEESLDEVPEAVRVAARLRVPTVWFKGAIEPAGRNPGLAGELDHARLKASVDEARRLASELDVSTNLAWWRREIDRVGANPPERRAPPPGRCLIPWLSVWVGVDGELLPCCNCAFHPEDEPVGRLGVDGSFDRLWRGPALSKLRDEMRRGVHTLDACRSCPDPVTVPCLTDAVLHRMWPGLVPGPGQEPR